MNVPGTHRIPVRRRGVFVFAAVFVVAWAGCVSMQPRAAMPEPVARVAVANLTDYSWEIAVRATPGGQVRTERLTPRTMAQLNLAGGDYVIEQKLLNEQPEGGGMRRFAARFIAGQDYTWSLATLRSTENGSPHPAEL